MSDADRMALENLTAELLSEPALKRQLEDFRAGRLHSRALTPGRVRGEQLSYAFMVASRVARFAPVGRATEQFIHDLGEDVARLAMAVVIRDSVPYLWKRDLALLAQSMPLPRHVIGNDLFSHDRMYWTLDNALDVTNPQPPYTKVSVEAYLVLRLREAYVFGMLSEVEHPRDGMMVALALERVPFGARYPDEARGGLVESCLHFAAFLNSPFVKADRERAITSKRARRRLGVVSAPPVSLNVVSLRAEVREAVAAERGEGPKWAQRWLVRGHYRAQWYPASRTHKVIWIAPHIKGPEDAPFKQPTYAVVR